MKYRFLMLIFNVVICVGLLPRYANAKQIPTKSAYRALIDCAAEYHFQESQNKIDAWKQRIRKNKLFGYSPSSYAASVAVLMGYMYQETRDEKYAIKAANLLLQYEDFKKLYPKEFYADRVEFKKGLPPISNFFNMNNYPEAWLYIRQSPKISAGDRKIIEKGIADCANFLLNYPEWGPMNRSILRAETCLYAVKALPNHPDTPKWRQMAEVLSSDSYQRWEEEDASGYHPVWLLSLFRFIDAAEDSTFFKSAVPYYYCDYFANLINPVGLVPDFGDGRWPNATSRWLPIFEKGAAEYQNPAFKWAAQRYWKYIQQTRPNATSLGMALDCIDALKWCDETVPARPPQGTSRLVMEEVIGKKIVFRNGIDSASTYLLLNYHDEGDGAFMSREYMRTTITAEEERVHHSHSDENSIVMLMRNGSILLHDAGYRDALPSGDYGAFRADYFHNRLTIRKNKRWIRMQGEREEQPVWEFLRNSGAYRPVETKLIDFFNFDQVDVSRTRVTDHELGYEWDRNLIYHKEKDFFIVVDGVKALRRDFFTYTNLWHTRQILAQGKRWFNTRIDSIGRYAVPGDQQLLVYFPVTEHERSVGTFDLRRQRQPEKSMYETISSYYYENQMEVFVTVLFPHAPGADLAKLVNQFELIETDKFPQAVGLKMNFEDQEQFLMVKLDLTMDYSQQNIRPRYTFELGKIQCGPILTDANFVFTSRKGKKLKWVATHMTRVQYQEKLLHQSLKSSFGLQPTLDPEVRWAEPKWRYWQDEISF